VHLEKCTQKVVSIKIKSYGTSLPGLNLIVRPRLVVGLNAELQLRDTTIKQRENAELQLRVTTIKRREKERKNRLARSPARRRTISGVLLLQPRLLPDLPDQAGTTGRAAQERSSSCHTCCRIAETTERSPARRRTISGVLLLQPRRLPDRRTKQERREGQPRNDPPPATPAVGSQKRRKGTHKRREEHACYIMD
jgi:hypothetical protein